MLSTATLLALAVAVATTDHVPRTSRAWSSSLPSARPTTTALSR